MKGLGHITDPLLDGTARSLHIRPRHPAFSSGRRRDAGIAGARAYQTALRLLFQRMRRDRGSAEDSLEVVLGSRDMRGSTPKYTPRARDMLIVAQDQHRQVLDAIERREGARAEAIMREHSRIAQRNLREAVREHNLDRKPGVRLIRQRG